MPKADFSTWTSPDSIGNLLKSWADNENRPMNGSFVMLKTK